MEKDRALLLSLAKAVVKLLNSAYADAYREGIRERPDEPDPDLVELAGEYSDHADDLRVKTLDAFNTNI